MITFVVNASQISKFATYLKPEVLDRAMLTASNEIGREISRLLKRTTRTWKDQPQVIIEVNVGGGHSELRAWVDSQVWNWLEHGTGLWGPRRAKYPIYPVRAKWLRFQIGYRAKTTPGSLTSRSGGPYGPYTYRKAVMHPGIEPRKWADEISIAVEPKIVESFRKHIMNWWERDAAGQVRQLKLW